MPLPRKNGLYGHAGLVVYYPRFYEKPSYVLQTLFQPQCCFKSNGTGSTRARFEQIDTQRISRITVLISLTAFALEEKRAACYTSRSHYEGRIKVFLVSFRLGAVGLLPRGSKKPYSICMLKTFVPVKEIYGKR